MANLFFRCRHQARAPRMAETHPFIRWSKALPRCSLSPLRA